jgi:hypothetical protein
MKTGFARFLEFAMLLVGLSVLLCAYNWQALSLGGLVPTNDYAANDLLIQKAKSLSLYHGNYSRVGFYHPGPFYFQIMAACELLLTDWFPVFKSPVSSHIFAGFVIHVSAIVVLYFSFRDYFHSRYVAFVATCVTVAIASFMIDTRNLYWGQIYFISIWPPLLYLSGATYVLAGLIGLSARTKSWLPILTLGFMMLIHGHAAFIGLVPVMIISLIGYAFLERFVQDDEKNILSRIIWRGAGTQITISIAIVIVFLIPIVVDVVKEGPENIQKYFSFAENGHLGSIRDVAAYLYTFLIWPLIFVVIEPIISWSIKGRKILTCSTFILVATLPAVMLYVFRGIDTFQYKYPLFWVSILIGGAASISIVQMLIWVRRNWLRRAIIGLVGICSIYSLSMFTIKPIDVGIDGAEFFRAVQILHELKVGRALVRIDAIGGDPPTMVRAVTLVAVDSRSGSQSFCISPAFWSIMYSEQYRCQNAADPTDVSIKILPAVEDGSRVLFKIYENFGVVARSTRD